MDFLVQVFCESFVLAVHEFLFLNVVDIDIVNTEDFNAGDNNVLPVALQELESSGLAIHWIEWLCDEVCTLGF